MSDRFEAGLLAEASGEIFSPAGRWETITDARFVGKPGTAIRIWTEQTGPGYSWRYLPHTVVRFRPAEDEPLRVVKLFEGDATMTVALSQPDATVWPSDSALLVRGQLLANSGGWQVSNHPNGAGEWPEIERYRNRGAARTAMWRLARVHAKALGLQLYGQRALSGGYAALRR